MEPCRKSERPLVSFDPYESVAVLGLRESCGLCTGYCAGALCFGLLTCFVRWSFSGFKSISVYFQHKFFIQDSQYSCATRRSPFTLANPLVSPTSAILCSSLIDCWPSKTFIHVDQQLNFSEVSTTMWISLRSNICTIVRNGTARATSANLFSTIFPAGKVHFCWSHPPSDVCIASTFPICRKSNTGTYFWGMKVIALR